MADEQERSSWWSNLSGWFSNTLDAAAGGVQNAWGAVADPAWRNDFMRRYQRGMGIYGSLSRALYQQLGASTGLLEGANSAALSQWWAGLSVPRTTIGRVGYFAGIGTPLLAGAAAFSGLNNIRRGRYGRGLLHLALGAGLVGAMYGASRWYPRPANYPPGLSTPW